jgi:hypothetical protein
MEIFKLDNMINGWFVGAFQPNVLETKDVEVGVKKYKSGDQEKRHYHKIATEITVIVSGSVKMNDVVYSPSSIIRIDPGESTDFNALTDAVITVVKIPGALNDKYIGGDENHA